MSRDLAVRPSGAWGTLVAGGLLLVASVAVAAVPAPSEDMQEQLWVYDPKGRCDPFIPLVRDGRVVPCETGIATEDGKGRQALPQLGGILWDAGGHSIALIDGREAQVGDAVGGYQISEIRRDEVVLSHDEEKIVLRISFDEQKTPKGGGGP